MNTERNTSNLNRPVSKSRCEPCNGEPAKKARKARKIEKFEIGGTISEKKLLAEIKTSIRGRGILAISEKHIWDPDEVKAVADKLVSEGKISVIGKKYQPVQELMTEQEILEAKITDRIREAGGAGVPGKWIAEDLGMTTPKLTRIAKKMEERGKITGVWLWDEKKMDYVSISGLPEESIKEAIKTAPGSSIVWEMEGEQQDRESLDERKKKLIHRFGEERFKELFGW